MPPLRTCLGLASDDRAAGLVPEPQLSQSLLGSSAPPTTHEKTTMTNAQLFMAIGIPILFNTVVVLTMFAAINRRFDDMRDLWRAELRRVEEVLDARLKHLEDRLLK